MSARIASIAALGLLAAAIASTPARAGSPCCCAMPCAAPAPPVVVYQPYEMPQIYVVDRGPVYSGPGIYTNPTVMVPRPMSDYPYVGYDEPSYLPPYSEPAPLRSRAQGVLPRRAIRRWQGR